MGLFEKKKAESATAPANAVKKTAPVNPDDIWNTPVRKNGDSVTVKESKYSESTTEKIKGVVSIEPEQIRDKMAKLEKELEEKKNKPAKTYLDYDVNPVFDNEITDAQTEYEKLYAVEHEKFVKSHYEDISVAQEKNLDEKVEKMLEEHDKKQQSQDGRDYGFNQVGEDEISQKLEQLSYAKKPEDYAEYKDIKSVNSIPDDTELDKLGKIDHSEDPDEIKEVSDEYLAQKVKEFQAKYGE